VVKIKIAVCIKQVPGTTEIKIDPETNTLVRQGIENIINPFDTYAIEEAVKLKERLDSVIASSLKGPLNILKIKARAAKSKNINANR